MHTKPDLPGYCGSKIKLEIEGISVPVISTLIGIKVDEYLLVQSPSFQSSPFHSPKDSSDLKHCLTSGNKVVIKWLFEGKVIAFETRIIEYIAKPEKLIFVEYPIQILEKDIRMEKRVPCLIPSVLIIAADRYHGLIFDINLVGCGFTPKMSDMSQFSVGRSCSIEAQFPGVHNRLVVQGYVQNILHKQAQRKIGIEFSAIPKDTQDAISSYIANIQDMLMFL